MSSLFINTRIYQTTIVTVITMSNRRPGRQRRGPPDPFLPSTNGRRHLVLRTQAFFRQFPSLTAAQRQYLARFTLRHRRRIGRSLQESRIQSAVHLVFYYLVSRDFRLNLHQVLRISTFIIYQWLTIATATYVEDFLPNLLYTYMSEPSSSGGSAAELLDNELSETE